MALMHVNFFSEVLGMSTAMDVIVPQRTRGQIGMEHAEDGPPYQVLYLLHGMSDDHTIWQRRTSIERYVANLPLVVVMPTTHLGWYTDGVHGDAWWTFISKELPEICAHFFPISDKREDTFAAGLSMGGYGAAKLGLVCPERFAAVATLSGAVDVVSVLKSREDLNATVFGRVFGDAQRIQGTDDDLFAAAERCAQKGELPKVYQWCGKQDFLYDANIRFRDHLAALGFELTYSEYEGDHQWKYWDEQIVKVLDWLPIRGKKVIR